MFSNSRILSEQLKMLESSWGVSWHEDKIFDFGLIPLVLTRESCVLSLAQFKWTKRTPEVHRYGCCIWDLIIACCLFLVSEKKIVIMNLPEMSFR